ncbi:hypothetical protein K1Y78_35585 [Streptomyces sp. tea 10]|nr:hypothetical protein [Streptomyces sp. tea 10]
MWGAIPDKWAALGWETGTLGFPVGDELSNPDGQGKRQQFEGGTVYWSAPTAPTPSEARSANCGASTAGKAESSATPPAKSTPTPTSRASGRTSPPATSACSIPPAWAATTTPASANASATKAPPTSPGSSRPRCGRPCATATCGSPPSWVHRSPRGVGMPRSTAVGCPWPRSSWRSFSSAPTRLTWRPSTSPSQPSASASAIRAIKLSRISASRARWAGSGRRSEHLTQASLNLRW